MGGMYSSEMSGRVYDEMQQQASVALADGKSVVMDGTHLKRMHRKSSLTVGVQTEAQTIIIECKLEEAEALRRIKTRYASGTSESEGRPEVYARQVPTWEQPANDEADLVVQVDTGGNVSNLPAGLFKALWTAVLAPAAT
jgi:predicted kinase